MVKPRPPPPKDPWWLGGIDLPVVNVGTEAEPILKHGYIEEPPRPRWSVKVDLFPLSQFKCRLSDWELVTPPKRTIYLSRIPIPGDAEYVEEPEVVAPRIVAPSNPVRHRAPAVAVAVCPANKAGKACGKICCNPRARYGLKEVHEVVTQTENAPETHEARAARLIAQAAEATAKREARAARNYSEKQGSDTSFYRYRCQVPAGFNFHIPAPAPRRARAVKKFEPARPSCPWAHIIGPRRRRPAAHKLRRTFSRRRKVSARRAARLAFTKNRELRSLYSISAERAAKVARNLLLDRAKRPTDPRLVRPGDFGCPARLFIQVTDEGQELLSDALNSEWSVSPRNNDTPRLPPDPERQAAVNIGTLHAGFFANSPQHHAILNGHLADYKKDLKRARMTTPYAVPSKLTHRLAEFGLEVPPVPAEAHPHPFNKNLELRGLRIATLGLDDNGYDMVCAKGYKLAFCPVPSSVQNPLFECKDLYRFRQQWDQDLQFTSDNIVWHDISSVVGPRELADRLGRSSARFMTVTGVNPAELIERAPSYDPDLYSIEYVKDQCVWRPEGSEHGHYQQPISVTKEWMSTNLVVLPDGRKVHIELLDYAAGHCVWFLSLVDCPASDVLTFTRREFIKVPSFIGGSYTPGQRTIPVGLLESLVRFAQRTPDLSWSNLQAKGSQVASTIRPAPSPLQIDVAVRAANYVVGKGASSLFARCASFVADVFAFRMNSSDEALLNLRDENLVVHRFGRSFRRAVNWGFTNAWTAVRDSMDPAAALALINATVGLLVIPKVIVSESLILLAEHYGSLWNALVTFYGWLDMAWWRAGVISAGVIATSMLPSSTTRYLSAAAAAMMDQLALFAPTALIARVYQTIFGLGPNLRYSGYCFTYQALLTLSGLAVLLPGAFVWWEEPWMMPIALVMGLTGHFPLWLLWRWIPFMAFCLAVDLYRLRCHWFQPVLAFVRTALGFVVVALGQNLLAGFLGHLTPLPWVYTVVRNLCGSLGFGLFLQLEHLAQGVYLLWFCIRLSLGALVLELQETIDAVIAHAPTLALWPLAVFAAIDCIELAAATPPPLFFTLAPVNLWSGLVVQCYWAPATDLADLLVPTAMWSPAPHRWSPSPLPIWSTSDTLRWLAQLFSSPATLLSDAATGIRDDAQALRQFIDREVRPTNWFDKLLNGCGYQADTPAVPNAAPFLGVRRMPLRTQAPAAVTPPPRPFPTIMTMSSTVPASPVAALRVDPGSYASFNAWASDIETIYNTLPPVSLDYGTSCFWVQAGSITGHSPCMWYAVFCAWLSADPYSGGPNRGKVSETMIQQFCTYTGIGVNMDTTFFGNTVVALQVASRPSWPVLNLFLSTLANGDRHVAHRSVLSTASTAGGTNIPAWAKQVQADLAASDVAKATPAQLNALKALPNLGAAIRSVCVAGPAPSPVAQPLFSNVIQACTMIEARMIRANLAPVLSGSPMIDTIILNAAGNLPNIPLQPADAAAANRLTGLPDIGSNEQPLEAASDIGVAPTESGDWRSQPRVYRCPKPPAAGPVPAPRVSQPRPIAQVPNAYANALKAAPVRPPTVVKRDVPMAESGPLTIRESEGVKVSKPLISRATTLIKDMMNLHARYYGLVLPQQKLSFETVMYTPDLNAARELASDLKAHPSLLEMKDASEIAASLDAIIKSSDAPQPVPVHIAFGVPGSGKTTLCRNTINGFTSERQEQTRIVSHNEFIRASLRKDFTMLKRGYNFPTLRHVIAEPSSGDVFMDDGGKLWGGVLDLLMLTNPLVENWWVNGDPGQGREQIPLPMCQSKHRPSPVHALAPLATQYATISHRVPHAIADAFGFYTTNSNVGFIKVINAPLSGMPYITSSERYVSVLSQSGRTAYTFGSCQGLEFQNPVVMDVSGLEQSLSDTNAVIALTRSLDGAYILTNFLWRNPLDPAPPTGSNLVNMLLAAAAQNGSPTLSRTSPHPRAAYMAHLHSVMPNLFADIGSPPEPCALNRDIGSVEVVSAVQMHYPATVSDQPLDLSASSHQLTETPLDSVLAEDPAVEGPHTWDPESRERVDLHGRLTRQFADDSRTFNPPFHSRYDRATEQLSLAKRISVVQPGHNTKAYRAASCPDLTATFDEVWPEPPTASLEALSACAERVIDEYCSRRTEAAVLNKIRQQDPDQAPTDIRLFLKQQVVKKIEKMYSDAIPGQLIHEFPLTLTLTDATYVLWIEENLLDCAPKNVTFLRRLTPSQIQERYNERWNSSRFVTGNDYTSWDQGCDTTILKLDEHIFRRCGLPDSFIASYLDRKLHSRSFPGLLAVMQNSGDRFTWPMNSLRNAVVTLTNLGYRPDVQYWFNGDDFVADDDLWPTGRLRSRLLFVGKPQHGWTTTFSGWTFGGPRCYYDASSLVYRLSIAEDRGTKGDYWQSAWDLLKLCDPLDPDTANASHILRRHLAHPTPTLDVSEL